MRTRRIIGIVTLALALASGGSRIFARSEITSPDDLIPEDRYDATVEERAPQPSEPDIDELQDPSLAARAAARRPSIDPRFVQRQAAPRQSERRIPPPSRGGEPPRARRRPIPPPVRSIDPYYGASLTEAPPPVVSRARVVGLPELIAGLVAKNFELKAQSHAINAAHRALQNARAQQLPLASLHSAFRDTNFDNRFRTISELFPPSLTDVQGRIFSDVASETFGDIFDSHAIITGMTVKVPVYHGDRLAGLPRAARVKENIEITKRERLQQDLILRLVDLYLDLLFENKRLLLEEQKLAKKQADLRVIQEKQRGALTLKQQILSVELEIEDIRQDMLEIENNRLVLRERIGRITGLPRDAQVVFKADTGLKELDGQLDDLVKEAKRANPAIRTQMKVVDLAGEQIALANAKDRTTIDFQFDYDHHYIPRNDDHSAGVYTANLVLNWDVVDFGRNHSEQREAREKREQQIAELEVLAQGLETEVRQTYYKYAESRKGISRADKNIELARENLRVTQERVDQALLLPVDLEEARVTLQKAVVSRERAMTQFTKSLAKLYHLMGQLVPALFAAG